MKVLIFGATGGVGRHLVPQALGAGHEVSVFARSPDRMPRDFQGVRVFQGDVLDPSAVGAALKGQDAVVLALGKPLQNRERLRAQGTRVVVDAMEASGARRLVCLSSFGTGNSFRLLPIHYRYLIAPLFMRALFADHGEQEDIVRASGLDWTLVRPLNFTDGPHTGQYAHGEWTSLKGLALKIARADVADFLLRQLTDDTYLRRAPGLSY